MNLAGAAGGADLGGSSKYSREALEDRCGEGFRNPIKLCGVFSLTRPQLWPKGNEVLIPQPDSGTDSALVPTRQREMSLRRPPELWEELSFLHKLPRPWNSFEERMGFGLAKSAAVLAVSMSDRRNLENQAEGYGGVASARTHIRSRSPR